MQRGAIRREVSQLGRLSRAASRAPADVVSEEGEEDAGENHLVSKLELGQVASESRMPLDPKRTVAELKELRALTGDADGAQRVAFTPVWMKARAWLREKLTALPVEVHTDAAGNLWATLRGESERELLIGGHIDSVPNGGWLDGCLNVLAGVEILRRLNEQYRGKPPVTVRLVDWADEEGARFGKSLFGSSRCRTR
jgi:hypothetical protein